MKYKSTRGGVHDIDFFDVVFSGYCEDKGLFVPSEVPMINHSQLKHWSDCDYSLPSICIEIFKLYSNEEIKPYLPDIFHDAFKHFAIKEVVDLRTMDENVNILELFHGPTLSFKDIGLSILALMMDYTLKIKKSRKSVNVIVSTSGDTGPSCLSAIALNKLDFVKVFVLFPKDRVSAIQRLQCTTMMDKCDNIRVYEAESDSDKQDIVMKNILSDEEFNKRYTISTMNSINFIRIIAQMSYYVYAYLRLIKLKQYLQVGDVIDFVVPCGALGNITAAVFTKKMGLPINIIGVNNTNNVLFETIEHGHYSLKTNIKTIANAMDSVDPYNIERIFWLAFSQNCTQIKNIMQVYEREKAYTFDSISRSLLKQLICKTYTVNDHTIVKVMGDIYKQYQYLLCPHSACSIYGALCLKKQHNDNEIVAIATAHPAKFREVLIENMNHPFLDNLHHPFLDKLVNEKQIYIQLKKRSNHTDAEWQKQWTLQIKQDIITMNQNQIKAKL